MTLNTTYMHIILILATFITLFDTFGESGDYKELYEKYEISSRHQVSKILQFLKRVS